MDYTLCYLTPTYQRKRKSFNSIEEARHHMRKLLKKGNYHFETIIFWGNKRRYINQWEAQI